MTDESDSLKLALRGSSPDDLSQPPPLRLSSKAALFLDFDGTLVDIAAHPDHVEVARALPGLIETLGEQLEGRLALVSGRALEALDRLLGPVDVAMAGSHGGEFRPCRNAEIHPLADPLPETIARPLGAFARDNGELLVEHKPFSMAVHYRGQPEMRAPLLALAHDLAEAHGAGVKDGKMVVEVVMPGSDKGSAVARFMDMPRFAGSTPYFIGDDVTDEDAFKAVTAMGGEGILVGPMRQTAACWRLESVEEVHAWLTRALADADADADIPAGAAGKSPDTEIAGQAGERPE